MDFEAFKKEGLIYDEATSVLAYQTGARFETGKAAFIMQPKTTEDVSRLVTYCVRNNIEIIPQSGNTGLVAASIPDRSGTQAILSLEKVKATYDLNLHNRSVIVGAGIRLSELNERLEPHGLAFPIDLGADPMIGGMVATNTGGARFLHYGDVRQNTLGLKVVLPDEHGSILDMNSALRKNNTGCDWKQMFIGTSGTFGIVTECVLNLHPIPNQTAVALVIPSDPDAIFQLLAHLERYFGSQLSAFEFMSKNAMTRAYEHLPSLRNPFENGEIPELALVVEISRSWEPVEGELPVEEFLQIGLTSIWETQTISDALFGNSNDIWSIRHTLSEGAKYAGHLFAFDLSFERDIVMEFRKSVTKTLHDFDEKLEICDFGHVGDGGLHFNVILPKKSLPDDLATYENELRDLVVGVAVEIYGGSYSAEHALGPKNQKFYDRYTPETQKLLADNFIKSAGIKKCGRVVLGT